LNDKYLCDGREITDGVIAELRLHCARESHRSPSSQTVKAAVRALCRLHKICPIPDPATLPEAQPTRYPPLPYRQELRAIINRAVMLQDDSCCGEFISMDDRLCLSPCVISNTCSVLAAEGRRWLR
jgi:hypothetical protein